MGVAGWVEQGWSGACRMQLEYGRRRQGRVVDHTDVEREVEAASWRRWQR